MNIRRLVLALSMGIGAVSILLVLLGSSSTPVAAGRVEGADGARLADETPIHYVATIGTDSGDCSTPAGTCRTIQYAVDQAGEGDEVRVATGVYTGVLGRLLPPGLGGPAIITQVVFITKTVTVRGGYTTTDWSAANPVSYPTTLDAERRGRVLYIAGEISPTIEGLRITGGDAGGLPGALCRLRGGGGCSISATVTLSRNHIFSNTADEGGGLFFWYSDATLFGNILASNTAGIGGGMAFWFGEVALEDNVVSTNTAGSAGGLYLYDVNVILSTNIIRDNSASSYRGGGVWQEGYSTTLISNTIADNWAAGSWEVYGGGGGMYLENLNDATLIGNTFISNMAHANGGGAFIQSDDSTVEENVFIANASRDDQDLGGIGGGLYLEVGETATLNDNTFIANSSDAGGGLTLEFGDVELRGNTIVSNTATSEGGGIWLWNNDYVAFTDNEVISNTVVSPWGVGGGLDIGCATYVYGTFSRNIVSRNKAGLYGGGMYLLCSNNAYFLSENSFSHNVAGSHGGGLFSDGGDAALINNVFAENRADHAGGGLCFWATSARLLHSTIARNHGGGICVSDWDGRFSSVVLTNTILVSHTVGITVSAGSTATLKATLWGTDTWANGIDWAGAGTILTGSVDLWGNPAFVAPDVGDYHIGLASAARDAGVDAGVNDDIDGDPRPCGDGFDIGADEFLIGVTITKDVVSKPVQPGGLLSYTLRVTNTGFLTLTATVTDLLPDHVTPTGVLTWRPLIPWLGGVWTQTVVVTVDTGYVGPLTNVVQVASLEGATGTYTHTLAPDLVIAKAASPNQVQVGQRLTYTIFLTNTGDFNLQPTITDILPAHVTPTGLLTWTPVLTAPGGVWRQSVVVTATVGYAGPLTNVVQATAQGGIRRVYTHTSTLVHTPGVKLTADQMKRADPDTVVTYTHTLTNTGNTPDIFDLSYDSSQGWGAEVNTPVSVNEYQTVTMFVTISVPAGVISGTVDTTIITATSRASEEIFDTVADVTTVSLAPGVALSPDHTRLVNPDSVITYTFTLTNTGNGPDTFHITHESSQGWTADYATPLSLDYNESESLVITLTVPPGWGGLTDVTIITATSQADPSVYATARATTNVNAAPIADAGPDLYVVRSDTVLLDGSNSTDPDGHLPLTYRWTRTGGPFVILVGVDTAQVAFQAPPYASVLSFTLNVTDTLGLRGDPDLVMVYVALDHFIYLPVVLRGQ